VAPSASVIGNVTIGSRSSVWYGAVVRGDVNKVTIGENTAIRERAVVHVAKIQGDFATLIGDNVTIGPCAIIHACTLQDSVMVGASAQVMDGSVVESHSMIAPGAIVTPGTVVKGGEYWAGSPAKMVRALTPMEIASIADSATDISELAMMHAVEQAKDYKQVAADEEARLDKLNRSEDYMQPSDIDQEDFLGQGAPGRIFNTVLSHPVEGLKFRQRQSEETAARVAELETAKKAGGV
jgi:carbonic anhydrase/acetyltransferase-like protein (isoleucine patch superfamily)